MMNVSNNELNDDSDDEVLAMMDCFSGFIFYSFLVLPF